MTNTVPINAFFIKSSRNLLYIYTYIHKRFLNLFLRPRIVKLFQISSSILDVRTFISLSYFTEVLILILEDLHYFISTAPGLAYSI